MRFRAIIFLAACLLFLPSLGFSARGAIEEHELWRFEKPFARGRLACAQIRRGQRERILLIRLRGAREVRSGVRYVIVPRASKRKRPRLRRSQRVCRRQSFTPDNPHAPGYTPGPVGSPCNGTAIKACADYMVSELAAGNSALLPLFYQYVKEPSISYSLMLSFIYGRYPLSIIDDLYANLEVAIDLQPDSNIQQNWRFYGLEYLLVGQFFACPAMEEAQAAELLTWLSYSSFDCTELISAQLATLFEPGHVDQLLQLAVASPNGWNRRNAWRVIVNMTMLSASHPAHAIVLQQRRQQIVDLLLFRLIAERLGITGFREEVPHDILYLLNSPYAPQFAAKEGARHFADSAEYSSSLRFRALGVVHRILFAEGDISGRIPEHELAYVLSYLNHEDQWLRALTGFFFSQRPLAFFGGEPVRDLLEGELLQAFDSEPLFVNRVYLALSLDNITGSNLFETMRAQYEQQHLGNERSAHGITIRSSLPEQKLDEYLAMMHGVREAFFDLLGAPFDQAIPGDPNDTVTLILLDSPERYEEYMSTFGPCCQYAGGVYIEQWGIFYTYDRTPQQSVFSTEQLIKHEFGHYLNGRYILPGIYGEPGYFDEVKIWLDEGFAEVLAGMENLGDGSYSLLPHPVHESAVCADDSKPQLAPLLSTPSYTPTTYTHSWALMYYLTTQNHAGLRNLFGAFRDDSYELAQFAPLVGHDSVSSVQEELHGAIELWCPQQPAHFRFGSSQHAGHKEEFPHFDRPAVPELGLRPSHPNIELR